MKSSFFAVTLIAATCGVTTAIAAETTRKSLPASSFSQSVSGAERKGAEQDRLPCQPQAQGFAPGCLKPGDPMPPTNVNRPAESRTNQRSR
jgi:hypothetical protein